MQCRCIWEDGREAKNAAITSFSTAEAAPAGAGSSCVAFPELPQSIAVHTEEKFVMCCPNGPVTRPGNVVKSECLQVSSQEQLCRYHSAKGK